MRRRVRGFDGFFLAMQRAGGRRARRWRPPIRGPSRVAAAAYVCSGTVTALGSRQPPPSSGEYLTAAVLETMDAVGLLRLQMDEAFSMLRSGSRGDPTTSSGNRPWRVEAAAARRRAVGVGLRGRPDPRPLDLLGWRVAPVLECAADVRRVRVGEGKLTWDRISSPHTAPTRWGCSTSTTSAHREYASIAPTSSVR